MTYRITGLDPAAFADVPALLAQGAMRVVADKAGAFPCRVTLEEAAPGERLILLNFVSADVATPYRASHAIYVREGARQAGHYTDGVPSLVERRTNSLRAFDRDGMMCAASLASAGTSAQHLRTMFADAAVDHVDIHTAAWGCFLARAERDDG